MPGGPGGGPRPPGWGVGQSPTGYKNLDNYVVNMVGEYSIKSEKGFDETYDDEYVCRGHGRIHSCRA